MRRLIGFTLLGLLIWAAYSIGGKEIPREPEAAAPASPPASVTAPPRLDKSDAAQQKRAALIRELIDKGIFQKVDTPGNLPRVYVRPAFYDLDFDMKQSFVNVVYAYHFDGSSSGDMVRVFDSRTNKPVGDFTTTGLSLN